MDRLTSNKDVKDMSMYELALNCCYYKNTNARYRDFDRDFDARDLVRQLMVAYGKWKNISQNGLDANNELVDDEIFDDTMLENLMCPPTDLEGLIALFYRNICAMAELREELKVYEDAEEGLLLKLPCNVGDESKSIGENCLKIQDIVNNQIIPREVCEEINHLLCDIIRLKREIITKLCNQQKTKNDVIKNEVINLLKCYRGDEDAKMKNFSLEHYIEKIIDMFDKWDL